MRDLILFIFLIAGTYLCSIGFAVVMFRIFFPLKAKENIQESKLRLTYSNNKMPNSSTKGKMDLLTEAKEGSGWAKVHT